MDDQLLLVPVPSISTQLESLVAFVYAIVGVLKNVTQKINCALFQTNIRFPRAYASDGIDSLM